MPLQPVEPDRLRAVIGHFATGVAVVTASRPGGNHRIGSGAVRAAETGGPVDPLIGFRSSSGGAP